MSNFITKIAHYISGELHQIEHTFDRLEDAIEAGIAAAAHSFKVYDKHGECHHSSHHHHHHHGHHPYC